MSIVHAQARVWGHVRARVMVVAVGGGGGVRACSARQSSDPQAVPPPVSRVDPIGAGAATDEGALGACCAPPCALASAAFAPSDATPLAATAADATVTASSAAAVAAAAAWSRRSRSFSWRRKPGLGCERRTRESGRRELSQLIAHTRAPARSTRPAASSHGARTLMVGPHFLTCAYAWSSDHFCATSKYASRMVVLRLLPAKQ